MKQLFLKDTADTFKVYIYENNRIAVPASATITVYKPAGTALINGSPMTIGADGLLSYTLSASDNVETGSDYKASIAYSLNGGVAGAVFFYDVVVSRPGIVITDDDLLSELPQLKDNGWRVCGSAEGGTSSAVTDAELKRYADDYFTGGLAYSAGKDETREITGFVSSTGTCTTTPFSSAITAGEKYTLTRSFGREIGRAFEKIEEMLKGTGRRIDLVIDPYDLRGLHIYSSVAEVCKGFISEKDNLWWGLWKEYGEKAAETFEKMNFKYDSSGDGFINSSERGAAEPARTGRG
ncbi:MAG: hypothetical protein HY884_06900 [Deltaproteobacteria bacterium]|nr:hypothetical protein [Deltaproteobacteria bacterium]